MNSFGLILGEPNSINSEILAKSNVYKKNCIIIGSYDLLHAQFKTLRLKINLKRINHPDNFKKTRKCLNVLDVPLKFKNPFKVKPKETRYYLQNCFNKAHKYSINKDINGFINCPINKKNLFRNKSYGITEYLAKKNNCYRSEVMMIYNKKLAVVPVTTHIRVKDIAKNLNKKSLIKKLKTLNSEFSKYFKKKPTIAIVGLNPHNFEFKNNSEEKKNFNSSNQIFKKKDENFWPLLSRYDFF